MRGSAAGLVLCAALAGAGCGSDADRRPQAGPPPAPSAARSWESLAPATLARTEVAAARVGRFAYVMGGFERGTGATTRATERYDIERDAWARVADMPVGLNHAAAAAYRGHVYVVGGYRARSNLDEETASMYRYDPRANRWRRQRRRAGSKASTTLKLPRPAARPASA